MLQGQHGTREWNPDAQRLLACAVRPGVNFARLGLLISQYGLTAVFWPRGGGAEGKGGRGLDPSWH
jgi:hypothetical protein